MRRERSRIIKILQMKMFQGDASVRYSERQRKERRNERVYVPVPRLPVEKENQLLSSA